MVNCFMKINKIILFTLKNTHYGKEIKQAKFQTWSLSADNVEILTENRSQLKHPKILS